VYSGVMGMGRVVQGGLEGVGVTPAAADDDAHPRSLPVACFPLPVCPPRPLLMHAGLHPCLIPRPPPSRLQVSASVAQAVALRAYQGGYATALPKPHNLLELVKNEMYNPQYRLYR